MSSCRAVTGRGDAEPSDAPVCRAALAAVRRLARAGLVLLAAWRLGAPPAAPAAEAPDAPPPGLVLVIGDGMGFSQRQVAGWTTADGWLAMDRLPVHGLMDTRNVDGGVTDSAAGGTAIACGARTLNKMVGVDRDKRPLTSLGDLARAAGMAIGLVSTTEITDATPAAVVAHVENRSQHEDVARQYLEAKVDVILGGGRRRFEAEPTARAGIAAGRYRLITLREELAPLVAPAAPVPDERILGLFSSSALPYVIDGDPARPALEQMTELALRRLEGSPRGFLLLVEGARIDHACHDNDLAAAIQETLELDRTVALLRRRLEGRANTLLVVTADHETGGLVLGRSGGGVPNLQLLLAARHSIEWLEDAAKKPGANLGALLAEHWALGKLSGPERELLEKAGAALGVDQELARLPGGGPQLVLAARYGVLFSTGGHTAAPVPLTGWGAGAEAIAGPLANAEVGRRLQAWLGSSRRNGD